MLKKLRLRLTLLCAAITAVILTGVTLGAYAVARELQEQSGTNAFQSDYNAIIYHLSTQTVIDQSWLARTESGNHLVVHIENNGEPLLFPGSWRTATDRWLLIGAAKEYALRMGQRIDTPPSSSVAAESVFFQLTGSQGERYRAAAASVPIPSTRGWVGLVLLKDLRVEDAALSRLAAVFAGLTVCGTLLLAAFSYWFSGRAIRPVEQSRKRQTEFVAAASHELRSPLAVIQTSAAAIPSAGPEQAGRFLGTIERECRRMSRLVDDLLLLARADAGTWSIQKQEIDAETLLLTLCEQYEGVAARKGIALTAQFEGDDPLPHVFGDEQRLGQVLSILIDNAVSYTPEGGSIRLRGSPDGGSVRLSVADTGPGIPEGAKARIFERFYRAESARSAKQHYGLGLSIAREIVALHQGKISVRNNPGGVGCTFVVALPAVAAQESRMAGTKLMQTDIN